MNVLASMEVHFVGMLLGLCTGMAWYGPFIAAFKDRRTPLRVTAGRPEEFAGGSFAKQSNVLLHNQ